MSSDRRLKRFSLKLAATILALPGILLFGSVQAQESDEAPEPDQNVEAIFVTGSRVVRDGFEAPTPITMVTSEEFEYAPTPNAADVINTMPAFSGSRMPTATNSSMSAGNAGLNALNLRGLGLERTLVLLDGRRSVASRPTGIIDINTFPQALISRVEIVTGGASAAYGADAVSGVVNFILDKEFTGIKGTVMGGVTNYDDNESYEFTLTAGTPFADGRGHLLFSGEVSEEDGVPTNDRPWNQQGWNIVANPDYDGVNGQPEYLVRDRVAPATGIVGGIITDTALAGTAFGPGGTPYQFTYGEIVSDPVMIGGAWEAAQIRGKPHSPGLTSRQKTQTVYSRLSYDLNTDTNAWFEASWSGNENQNWCCFREDTDRLVISTENAFIPASVAARANDLGITQFTMGSMNQDLGRSGSVNDRSVQRFTFGLDGIAEAFDTEWVWNAYVQRGYARLHQEVFNVTRRSRYDKALDSVIHPVTGLPACRVNADADPGNDDSLCVPYNIFGIGVNSQPAIDYILGNGARDMRIERLTQHVVAGSVSGTPFDSWAGPVSIAAGVEYRNDEVEGENDPISRELRDWFYGNYRVYDASLSVTEVFVETVVPLAADEAWAQSLDLNAAVRGTDYETSGYVTTWKLGVTWSMADDISFRGTLSRDIRAPTLDDLYSKGGGGFPGVVNPFRGGISENTVSSTSGNPALTPEKSDYIGVGFVFQPTFLEGFTASVDYWDIDITDAIGGASSQEIINFCFEGRSAFCDALTFGPNQEIELISITPFNLDSMKARGIDLEARYLFAPNFLGIPGDLSLSAKAAHVLEKVETTATGEVIKLDGQNRGDGVPEWRWRAALNYGFERVRANLTARGISEGVYDPLWIECTSGCPASSTLARTIETNTIDGATWFDASLSYDLSSDSDGSAVLFFNVRNIADKDPAVVAPGPGGFSYEAAPSNPNLYDTLGRTYSAGLRFSL